MRYLSFTMFTVLLALASTVFAQKKTTVQPKPVKKTPAVVQHDTTRLAVLYMETKTDTTKYTATQRDSMSVWRYTRVTYPCDYLSAAERDVIQVLNIARMYPKWFLYFYLRTPSTENEKSLYKTMSEMKSIAEPLQPDRKLFESARCHALSSGKTGYTGHERQDKTCKKTFNGECCEYGNSRAVGIVLNLLIDEGVPSLGHRMICLDGGYKKIGVSTQPHKAYGSNTVLDFSF